MFLPVTVRAVDNNGKQLFQYSVPFQFNMNARQALETAFAIAQSVANPDPFVFTLEYFGYSEYAQYAGYLGYEIESIGVNGDVLANNTQFFWELLLNGIESPSGADTTHPLPGSTVAWRYTAMPASLSALGGRAKAVFERRSVRAQSRAGTAGP